MLKQRLIYGTIGAIAAIAVITFCPLYIIGICIGLIALIGLFEFYKVTGLLSHRTPAVYMGFAYSALSFAAIVFKPEFAVDFLLPAIVLYVFALLISMVFFGRLCSIRKCATSLFGAIYITVFFSYFYLIRASEMGKITVWLLFIAAWSTDTFAYFTGRAIGKHRLCPDISPKKTSEGAFGGFVGCIICVFVYVKIIAKINGFGVETFNVLFLAALTSAVSQFGDLAASCIKREVGVKDYGNLIPGHGGILDRFDSSLLIAPIVYYFLQFFDIFTK